MSNNNMDMTNNEIFRLGMEVGRKQLADHIQHQFKIGKPVEINGELYWLKDAKQNLMDIMDDIESAWNEEHGVKKFIVPISITYNTSKRYREVIVEAEEAKTAMLIAIGDFQSDGWIVDTDYENYKQFKGQVKAMENGIKHKRGTGRERVYNFIVEFIKNNGYAPSVREICN